jgi:hypothetical protein
VGSGADVETRDRSKKKPRTAEEKKDNQATATGFQWQDHCSICDTPREHSFRFAEAIYYGTQERKVAITEEGVQEEEQRGRTHREGEEGPEYDATRSVKYSLCDIKIIRPARVE